MGGKRLYFCRKGRKLFQGYDRMPLPIEVSCFWEGKLSNRRPVAGASFGCPWEQREKCCGSTALTLELTGCLTLTLYKDSRRHILSHHKSRKHHVTRKRNIEQGVGREQRDTLHLWHK